MTFSKLSGIFANELMTMINNIRSKFQCLFFSDKYFAQKNMNSSSLKCKASDCILIPLSKFFKSITTNLRILIRKHQHYGTQSLSLKLNQMVLLPTNRRKSHLIELKIKYL